MNNFNELTIEGTYLTRMFSTARQFNKAIDSKAVMQAGIIENALNKTPVLIYPYIVNKAFACEVYLKLIIKENNFNAKFSSHDLVKLYNDSSFNFIY